MTLVWLAKICLMVVLGTYLPLFLGVARFRRPLAVTLVAATLATLGLSAAALADGDQTPPLAGLSLGIMVGGIAVGLVSVGGLAWLAWRFPGWALPIAVAVAPLRVPLPIGDETFQALVPLYLCILAVLIAEVVVRDRLRPPPATSRDSARVTLAILIGLVGVSALWAGLDHAPTDQAFAAALVEIVAFYLPFGLLFALAWRYIASSQALGRIMSAVVTMGTVLAAVGVVQYFARFTILNRETILRELELGHGFRINSLLWDPNMLSRYLLVVIVFAAALATVRPKQRLWLCVCAGLAATADALTFSRAGWALLVLAAVLFALAVFRSRKLVVIVVSAVVLIGGLAAVVSVRDTHITLGKLSNPWGINRLTGGRYYLARSGLEMAAAHPLTGVGTGNFSLAYEDFRDRHAGPRLKESHTTPITLLAEGGIPVGLAYVAVILALGFASVRAVRGSPDRTARALMAAIAAVLTAIALHSLVYNAFFEDPTVWVLMAAVSAAAAGRLGARPPAQSCGC